MAESYGIKDQIDFTKNVSVLDVLVRAHELVYEDAFTKETMSEFLSMNGNFVKMAFGIVDDNEKPYTLGFFLNYAYAHDGTKIGSGYNGTTVATQSVVSGDVVEFFFYGAEDSSDGYTWFEDENGYTRDVKAFTDEDIKLSVKYYMAAYAYKFKDAAEMHKNGMIPIDARIAIVDKNGGLDKDTVKAESDDDGAFTFRISKPGEYSLVAYSNDEDEKLISSPITLTVTERPDTRIKTTIVMNDISRTAKLYSINDVSRKNDFLKDVTPDSKKTYEVKLDSGDYILEGIGDDGKTGNGTIKITVDENNYNFKVWTVTAYAKNAGWIYGKDYTIEDVHVRTGGDKATVLREITVGDSVKEGQKTFLVLNGDAYEFYGVPTKDRPEYAKTYLGKSVTGAFQCKGEVTIEKSVKYSVTYPFEDIDNDGKNDYVLESGQMFYYFKYSYSEPENVTKSDDKTKETAVFSATKNQSYFYRVSNKLNKNVVTYGNYVKASSDENPVEVTKEMLYAEDGSYNSHTVIRDYSQNNADVGDIYLNVNEKGFLNLKSGAQFNLCPLRNWLPIEGTGNAQVIEPDFHVSVINIEGEPITVKQNVENNESKNSFMLTANNKGTAIVLVTYDAVTNGVAMTGKTDGKVSVVGSIFSAIWPENTGVFVVTVDGNTGFDTGMKINAGKNNATQKLSGDYIDSEHDVLYYSGNKGASYTFTPAEGTDVSMAVCSYTNNNMTFGAFTKQGVTKNSDGSVTLSGLTEGKTIVKLSNGDKSEYQVLKSIRSDYKIYKGAATEEANLFYNSENNSYNYDNLIKPGDKVTILYSKLFHPANKTSGIYNVQAKLFVTGEDGKTVNGTQNNYYFASSEKYHQVTVTIPSTWEKSTYKLVTNLLATGWGSPYGAHREVTYKDGKTSNMTAIMVNGTFAQFDDIVICLGDTVKKVAETEALIEAIGTVSLESEDLIKTAEEAFNALTEDNKLLIKNADDLKAARKSFELLKREAEEEAYREKINKRIADVYATTKQYLESKTKDYSASIGSIGGEWWIIGLARAGSTPANSAFYNDYYKTVENKVKSFKDSERFDNKQSTDNSRVILALTALGYDPTNIAGHNLLKGLNSMDYITWQGVNGPIWALIAFDSGAYEIPANDNSADVVTRDKLITEILKKQTSDGGWAFYGNDAELDITGMALQALAPYYNSNDAVKVAVDKALNLLSVEQNENGGFAPKNGVDSCESLSQVLVALTSLGINPFTDSRFVKNGHSIMEAFETLYVEGGGFKHVPSGNLNGMATEQGFYALVSYMRLVNGQTGLYNMSDVKKNEAPDPSEITEPTGPVSLEQNKIDDALVDVSIAIDKIDEAIEARITPETQVVTIDMKNSDGTVATVVPTKVLEAIKGQDIDVVLNMGDYSWTINGKDITAETIEAINLEVKITQGNVPEDVISELSKGEPTVLFSLTHNGDFGFTAKLKFNFGTGFTGKYANLFWYKNDGSTELIDSGLVGNDGNAELTFTHASEYVVVLSDINMKEEGVLDADFTNNDVSITTAPQTSDNSRMTILFMLIVMCLFMGAAAAGRLKRDNE